MTNRTYTIGRFARLAGVTVKRVRFYADQQLLVTPARTERGYRLFTDEDFVRMDLILSLREAGFGLADIRRILDRPVALGDALRIRLAAVEAQIESQSRVAKMLRTALASPSPTIDDLRRIHTMTNLSQTERRTMIERFFEQVSEEVTVVPKQFEIMARYVAENHAETLTSQQIDSWIELSRMMADPAFVTEMRASLLEQTGQKFRQAKGVMNAGMESALEQARAALAANAEPGSEAGRRIAETFVEYYAKANRQTVEEATKKLRQGSNVADPESNTNRYWRLMVQLRHPSSPRAEEKRPELAFLWASVRAWREAELPG